MQSWTRRRVHFIWRYVRGKIPWDSGIVPPEIVAWVASSETNGDPPGRALDLGCGTGTTSLYLAARGWTVIGADFAPNAIRRARRKARQQTITGSVRFISADVSRPVFLADEPPFHLLIDVGCLHALTPPQRAGYAANVKRLARPGAVFLLYAFKPQPSYTDRRRLGITREGVEMLLDPAFEMVSYTEGEEATVPRPSAWYALRRTETPT